MRSDISLNPPQDGHSGPCYLRTCLTLVGMRTPLRIAAASVAVALVAAAAGSAPATAQPSGWEIRLEATGDTTISLLHDGQTIPLPAERENTYGWSGDGVFVMETTGAGSSCRIVANGAEVAAAGGGTACRWP